MKSQPWLEIYNELNIKMPRFADHTMGTYLEAHAQAKSDAIALTMFDKSMTFAECNAQANRLANALSKRNIGQGDVVGLHMPNILQYVIALAAISKLGAIGTGISPIMAHCGGHPSDFGCQCKSVIEFGRFRRNIRRHCRTAILFRASDYLWYSRLR